MIKKIVYNATDKVYLPAPFLFSVIFIVLSIITSGNIASFIDPTKNGILKHTLERYLESICCLCSYPYPDTDAIIFVTIGLPLSFPLHRSMWLQHNNGNQITNSDMKSHLVSLMADQSIYYSYKNNILNLQNVYSLLIKWYTFRYWSFTARKS